MTLHVRFWGTRGSIPSPGPRTVRYGGNTSCLEVRAPGGGLVVLDAGTGIRALGEDLLGRGDATPVEADIYLTHAHWDHIQGLPFFAPLFRAGHRFRIRAGPPLATRIERAVRAQMAPEVFPIPFDEVRAAIEFCELTSPRHAANGLVVEAHPARHPGGASGFRVATDDGGEGALVYLPDNELDAAAGYDEPADWRARLVAFVRGATLLVHDAMYTDADGGDHRGWGHSTSEEAIDLALEAGVPRLALFHHHPERADADLDALLDRCRSRVASLGGTLDVLAAAEGRSLAV